MWSNPRTITRSKGNDQMTDIKYHHTKSTLATYTGNHPKQPPATLHGLAEAGKRIAF